MPRGSTRASSPSPERGQEGKRWEWGVKPSAGRDETAQSGCMFVWEGCWQKGAPAEGLGDGHWLPLRSRGWKSSVTVPCMVPGKPQGTLAGLAPEALWETCFLSLSYPLVTAGRPRHPVADGCVTQISASILTGHSPCASTSSFLRGHQSCWVKGPHTPYNLILTHILITLAKSVSNRVIFTDSRG